MPTKSDSDGGSDSVSSMIPNSALSRLPTVGVVPVLEVGCRTRHSKRAECVEHYGQLLSALVSQARLDRARLRAVRNPGRMQRDRSLLDAPAAAEPIVAVVEHLITFEVAVI